MAFDINKDSPVDKKLLALYSAKKYDECMEMCKEFLAINPLNVQALFYISHISLEKGNLDDCIHYCDTIIRAVEERIYITWLWRGQALCLQQKYDDAVASFEQAIKYGPSREENWFGIAFTLFLKGKKELAIFLLDGAEIEFEKLRGRFSLVRGYIERADGNIDEALFHFIQGGMTTDPASKDYLKNKEMFADEVGATLKKKRNHT